MNRSLRSITVAAALGIALSLGAVAPAQASVPHEYKDALATAQNYVRVLDFSKAGLYDQLTSSYGSKFPKKAADYALAHVRVNYSKEALSAAKSYRKLLHLSRAAIYDQLVSKYGGKYTKANATYALKHLH